jgi:y4mF family transcriptional regulator
LHIIFYIWTKYEYLHIAMQPLSLFISQKRKATGLTQIQLAKKAGVALTVIRKIEQGKQDLQLSKVNQVLAMFGHTLCPVTTKLIQTNEASTN